jgi:hypothetical protein
MPSLEEQVCPLLLAPNTFVRTYAALTSTHNRCSGRATAIDASCGAACPAAERVGRIFVSGEEDAADELRGMQVHALGWWRTACAAVFVTRVGRLIM